MQQQIKAIILDIGNVLVDFCYEEFVDGFTHSPEHKRRLIPVAWKRMCIY
ncbi:MAG: hypothetical protein R3Y67_05140 [Eubacteriales bacterium]